MPCNITVEWVCDECGFKEVSNEHGLGTNYLVLDHNRLPPGWSCLHYSLICPNHIFKIKKKDEIDDELCSVCGGKRIVSDAGRTFTNCPECAVPDYVKIDRMVEETKLPADTCNVVLKMYGGNFRKAIKALKGI